MKGWVWVACVSGLLAVAMGAFGAHALRDRLEPRLLHAYETGVLYHLLHSVVLLALALYARSTGVSIAIPAALFAAGMLCFSGSLYLLTAGGVRAAGPITPIGLLLIAAWASSAFQLSK